MDKFLNKYRIPSNQRPNWDYSDDGAYFITLVTQNRICNLGTIVETHGRASLQSNHPNPSNCPNPTTFIRKPQSISSFIAGFKSAVNSKIDDYIDENNLNISKYNRNNHFFQSNFHDHIIRNSTELERIQNYILNNPMNWKDDKFYS